MHKIIQINKHTKLVPCTAIYGLKIATDNKA